MDNLECQQINSTNNKITKNLRFNPYLGYIKSGWLGFAFLLIFFSYSVAQTALSSMTEQGLLMMILIYGFLMVGALFVAPYVVLHLKPKISFTIASLIYTIFVATLNTNNEIVMIVMSVLVGLSASTIWVLQATYIANLYDQGQGTLGRLTGSFTMVYSPHGVIGQVTAMFLYSNDKDTEGLQTKSLIWVLSCVSLFGTIAFMFVPNISLKFNNSIGKFKRLKKACKWPIPLIMFGTFVRSIIACNCWINTSKSIIQTFGPRIKSIFFAVYTVPIALTAMFSILTDKYLIPILIVHCLSGVVGTGLLLYSEIWDPVYLMFMGTAIVLGLFESTGFALNNVLVTKIASNDEISETFASCSMINSFGVIFITIVSKYVSDTKVIVGMITIGLSVILVLSTSLLVRWILKNQ